MDFKTIFVDFEHVSSDFKMFQNPSRAQSSTRITREVRPDLVALYPQQTKETVWTWIPHSFFNSTPFSNNTLLYIWAVYLVAIYQIFRIEKCTRAGHSWLKAFPPPLVLVSSYGKMMNAVWFRIAENRVDISYGIVLARRPIFQKTFLSVSKGIQFRQTVVDALFVSKCSD